MKSKFKIVAVVAVYVLSLTLFLYVCRLVIAATSSIFKVGLEAGSVYISQETAQILAIYSLVTAVLTLLTWLAAKSKASKVGLWLSVTALASLALLVVSGVVRII